MDADVQKWPKCVPLRLRDPPGELQLFPTPAGLSNYSKIPRGQFIFKWRRATTGISNSKESLNSDQDLILEKLSEQLGKNKCFSPFPKAQLI